MLFGTASNLEGFFSKTSNSQLPSEAIQQVSLWHQRSLHRLSVSAKGLMSDQDSPAPLVFQTDGAQFGQSMHAEKVMLAVKDCWVPTMPRKNGPCDWRWPHGGSLFFRRSFPSSSFMGFSMKHTNHFGVPL